MCVLITGRYGYLVWLAVSKTAQGLGVGKKLLHCFEEAMKVCVYVRVCFFPSDNASATFSHVHAHTTNTDNRNKAVAYF